MLPLAPLAASRESPDPGLSDYLQARLAEADDRDADAARLYALSLKADPANAFIAGRAYRAAVEAGDYATALKASRVVSNHGTPSAETALFTFSDAFAKGDWRLAAIAADELTAAGEFGFLQPLLRYWVAQARGENTASWSQAARDDKIARYYIREVELLGDLVRGREAEVVPLLAPVVAQNQLRMAPFRIMAARHFIAKGDAETARDIVIQRQTGVESRIYDAVEAGDVRGLGKRIDPRMAAAFLFNRVGSDLAAQQAGFLSQVMALNAYRIAPDSDHARLSLVQAYGDGSPAAWKTDMLYRIGRDSPYRVAATTLLATRLSEADQSPTAMTILREQIASMPEEPDLYLLLGQIAQRQGDWDAAIAAFTEGLALAERLDEPENQQANFLLSLGGVQEEAGQWDAARDSLMRANELLPDSPTILNYLGYSQLERRENVPEALQQVERAYALRSNSAAITDSLGWGLFLTGDAERAVDYLEQARLGQPADPTINEHLGDVYWELGRHYEARYAWRAARLFAEEDHIARLEEKIADGLSPDLVSP